MFKRIIKRMGLYLRARTVFKSIRDNNMGSIAPGSEASVTGHTKLTALKVQEAIEFASEEKLLTPPGAPGENYILNYKGKRYLRGYKFYPSGVIDKYAKDHGWKVSLFGGFLGALLLLILKWVLTGEL